MGNASSISSSVSSRLSIGTQRRSSTKIISATPTKEIPVRGDFRYHFDRKVTEDYFPTGRVLGTGLNGPVQVCVQIGVDDASEFALKSVKKPNEKNPGGSRLVEFLRDELEVYLNLDNPHIAKLYNVYETQNEVQFVMELCTGGELFTRLTNVQKYAEADAQRATRDMVKAINYLHSMKIVHRDIKLENFLYEDESNEALLKLIDFGFAKHVNPASNLTVSCGSLQYVAPEVLRKDYTEVCDMWSLGVTTFILLFGYPPFYGESDRMIRSAIQSGEYKIRDKNLASKKAMDFIAQCLQVLPDKRLTAAAALEHAWLAPKAPRGEAGRPETPDSPEFVGVLSREMVKEMQAFAAASQMRRACLGVAVHCVTPAQTKELRKLFLDLDINGDGTISFGELRDAIATTTRLDVQEITDLFNRLDQYKDKQLNYNEFLAATLQHQLRNSETVIRATFNRFDVDRSGFITKENIKEVLGKNFDAAKLMEEADYAKDGKINYDEFFRYMTEGAPSESEFSLAEDLFSNPELDEQLTKKAERAKALVLLSADASDDAAPSPLSLARGISPAQEAALAMLADAGYEPGSPGSPEHERHMSM